MFKDVDVDWVGRKHPKKRGVECVDSWEVLPDRGRIGQALLLMRFQDDHISNSQVHPRRHKSSVFNRVDKL